MTSLWQPHNSEGCRGLAASEQPVARAGLEQVLQSEWNANEDGKDRGQRTGAGPEVLSAKCAVPRFQYGLGLSCACHPVPRRALACLALARFEDWDACNNRSERRFNQSRPVALPFGAVDREALDNGLYHIQGRHCRSMFHHILVPHLH